PTKATAAATTPAISESRTALVSTAGSSSSPHVHQLENGLKVILERDAAQPFVAVRMTYLSGSASDPRRRPGLAHLTEHMAFSRTRHTSRDLMLEVQSLGALEFNGETSLDTTVYYETVPNNRLE